VLRRAFNGVGEKNFARADASWFYDFGEATPYLRRRLGAASLRVHEAAGPGQPLRDPIVLIAGRKSRSCVGYLTLGAVPH
jgi:hypothetical protein